MIKDLHWAKYMKVILRNNLQNNFKEKTNEHIDQWNLNWIQVIDVLVTCNLIIMALSHVDK